MISQITRQCRKWLGESQVELSIDLFGEEYHRGEELRGRVRILSQGMVRVVSVTLTLVEWRVSGDNEPSHRLKLVDDLMVSPLQPQSLPFHIVISDTAPLSRITSGCRLEARAVLTGGDRELTAVAHPQVLPHRESYAVMTAFCKLGFHSTSSQKEMRSGVLTSKFEPFSVEDGVRSVNLDVRVKEKSVAGSIEVIKINRGKPGDYRADFVIPRELLVTEDHKPNPEPAVPYLRRALAEAMLEPDDPARRLLRAATGPQDKSLLRPAENGAEIDPNTLLRPAD